MNAHSLSRSAGSGTKWSKTSASERLSTMSYATGSLVSTGGSPTWRNSQS